MCSRLGLSEKQRGACSVWRGGREREGVAGVALAVAAVLTIWSTGCAQRAGPHLSSLQDAPTSIRESVQFDMSDSANPAEHYRMRRSVPIGTWIDLDADFSGDLAYVRGLLTYDDSGAAEEIAQICVDTGSNGFLSIALTHSVASRVWVSEEYGEREGKSLGGRHRAWRGVAVALSIGGVTYRPAPLEVADVSEASLVSTPLLGQEWFDITAATWIDPTGDVLAVSFDPSVIGELLGRSLPGHWVSVPWRAFKPSGHRYISIEIGGRSHEAIIDTGADGEVFLEMSERPEFVGKPWRRTRIITPAGDIGSAWTGVSDAPLKIGTLELDQPSVVWLVSGRHRIPSPREGQSVALLGLDFLRRVPVLLDPPNDLAHFFVGDRAELPALLDLPSSTPP